MSLTKRLGLLANVVLLCPLMAALVSLPSRHLSLEVLGSRLALSFTGGTQITVVAILLVWAGTDAVIKGHPDLKSGGIGRRATMWMLPGLLVVSAIALLQRLDWWGYRVLGSGLTAASVALVVGWQYRTASPSGHAGRGAQLALAGLVYVLALGLYIALYGSRTRSILSASGVLVVSALLAVELLRNATQEAPRAWLYALIIGVCVGELTWALNYSSVEARVGGGFLLLVFYTMTGATRQYLAGTLTPRVVYEHAAVFAMGLVILSWLSRLLEA